MHKLFRYKAYEAEHGPHFDEKHARKAVSKMENEDGSRGPHWSVEETTALANQHGIKLNDKFNRYDWYVALNMVYSDYYKVIAQITNSSSTKHFVEFAKAWLCDKDIDEGKMWFYYIYVMCNEIREEEMEKYEEEGDEEDDEEDFGRYRRGGNMMRNRYRMGRRTMAGGSYRHSEYDEDDDREYDMYNREYPEYNRSRTTRYIRY